MKQININYVDGLTTQLDDLQTQIDGIGSGGFGNVYDTIASVTGATFDTAPSSVLVLGYYSVGDGGSAVYTSPVSVDPATTDSIQINVAGTPYWLSRAHVGSINLLAHGLKGDDLDESVLFTECLALAESTGIRKITCPNAGKSFRLVGVEITNTIEIDLNGSKLTGNFDVENAGTCTTVLKSDTPDIKITLRNLTIDGGNNGVVTNPSGAGGHPVVLFTGSGADIYCVNMIFTSGGNRNGAAYAHYSESLYGEFEVKYAKKAKFYRCKFTGSPGEVLAILDYGGDSIDYTMVEIDDCEFDKNRSYAPFSPWSSSSIVVYNCGKGSYVRNCTFGQHYKSAVNWFGPGTVENCRFYGVYDSNGLDFNETGVVNIDNIVVRSCYFQNITNGYAIRASARNVIIEDIEIHRCQNGIYLERYNGSSYSDRLDGLGSQRTRDMYNIWIKNIVSNGNDVVDGSGNAVANSLIKLKGVSESQPVRAYIYGTGVQNSPADWPSANPEYGIHAENAEIYMEGAYQHGRSGMVYMTGYSKLVARNCQFYPQPAATTNILMFSSATVSDIVLEDCQRFGTLDSGYYDILFSASSISGRCWKTRSSSLSATSGTFTTTTNYGA
jgi:hypothetical protein